MKYTAVIFDLDGTLLDTLDDIAEATNRVLQSLGYPSHPSDDYRYFVGAGVRALFGRALPAATISDELMERCMQRFAIEYGAHWNVHTQPYEGIAKLLDALTQRGLKLAVLSNKPDAFTRLCVSQYLDNWRFEPVLGQREGVPRKPDPTAVVEILNQWGLQPQRCLYVGDTGIDMQAAVAADVFPVGVLWGFRPEEELAANGAQLLIRRPMDLLDCLTEEV